jgi:hypothetical protein
MAPHQLGKSTIEELRESFDRAAAMCERMKLATERLTAELASFRALRDGSAVENGDDEGAPKIIDSRFAVQFNGLITEIGDTFPLAALRLLLRWPGRWCSAERLRDTVWQSSDVSPGAIAATLARLRRQLADGGMHELAQAIEGNRAGAYLIRPIWTREKP